MYSWTQALSQDHRSCPPIGRCDISCLRTNGNRRPVALDSASVREEGSYSGRFEISVSTGQHHSEFDAELLPQLASTLGY